MAKNSSKDEVTFEEKFNDYGEYKGVNEEEQIKIDSLDDISSYKNYDYDKDNTEYTEDGTKDLVKRLLLVIGAVLLIIIIILLFLKSCTTQKDNGSLEAKLLEAGKQYYEDFNSELPTTKGTCNTITLNVLNQLEYLDKEEFSVCESENTYVKICFLPNKTYHYTPIMECEKTLNDTAFGNWNEGSERDLTPDKSDVKFQFLASYIDSDNTNYGKTEEIWKDEIKYTNYKTIKLTNYYKYRDKEYIWTLRQRYYYPGDKTDENSINTYYLKYPSNTYINKTSKSTVYRWYLETNKEYYPSNNGYSKTQPAGYSLTDAKENLAYLYYSTRTWIEETKPTTTNPVKYYKCSNGTDLYYYSLVQCSLNENPYYNDGYTTTIATVYTCDNGLTYTTSTDKCIVCSIGSLKYDKLSCGNYSTWSTWKINEDFSPVCNIAQKDICKTYTSIVSRWYQADRNYVGNTSPTGQVPYYKTSPETNAIKNLDSAVLGYKWYKLVNKSKTKEYYPNSPEKDAIKTNDSKWGEWSNYSLKQPASSLGLREIEKRVKVTLKSILLESDIKWNEIDSKYLTEEELISKLKKQGFEVNSLEDIEASGDIKLTIKLFYRERI